MIEVDRLADLLDGTIFRDTVRKCRAEFGEEWEVELGGTINRVFPGPKLVAAVKGYVSFCLEIMRLQIDFERSGVYAPQTYAQATEAVYANTTYMRDCYLPGLLLAWYLWPHHYRQVCFFKRTFVHEMSRRGATKFYDVATGTGLYSRLALRGALSSVGLGYDIGAASCAFTMDHVAAYGASARYDVYRTNVIEDPPGPVDWLICVELLEHLDQPMALLHSLRRMLNPRGKMFIATALNAPNSDHILLLRTVEEAASLISLAGFTIEQVCANAAPSTSRTPPTVVAFICR